MNKERYRMQNSIYFDKMLEEEEEVTTDYLSSQLPFHIKDAVGKTPISFKYTLNKS